MLKVTNLSSQLDTQVDCVFTYEGKKYLRILNVRNISIVRDIIYVVGSNKDFYYMVRY